MALTADDGTLLKAKEGIVLDQDGQPLTSGYEGAAEDVATIRSFSFPVPSIIGIALLIPVAIALGVAFVGGFGILLAIIFVINAFSRFFVRR